jgi:hypothetical protein
MKKIIFTIICLATAFVFTAGHQANAQTQALDTLNKKFDYYRKHNLQEKIYLHVDRTTHLTGEIFWFKVYCVDGTFNKPLNVSKVAYVEVLDKNNLSLLQAKVPMEDGVGNGSLFLPASLTSGRYQLRAYTAWMKNTASDFFFHETITIINTFVKPDLVQPSAASETVTLNLFPEGGNLVDGIRSRVGVKATDKSGLPVDGHGAVINSANDTLSRFKTLHAGIGSFSITASQATALRVVFIDSKGHTSQKPLPNPIAEGYVMTTIDSGANLVVKVRAKFSDQNQRHIYLFAHARQVISCSEFKFLIQNECHFTIPKQKLQNGISHLTVFDENLTPVCERLYFKYPTEKLDISTTVDQSVFGGRRKVKIEIETHGRNKSLPANLSLSVFKNDSLSAIPTSLFEFLWLSSDLKGVIDKPEFYFSKSEGAELAIDNLMLTQGWRRFTWEEALGRNHNPKYAPEARRHIVRGKVLNSDGTPARSILTFLGSPDKIIRAYFSRSDAAGNVQFEVKEFSGLRQLVFQSVSKSDTLLSLSILNPFATDITDHMLPPFYLTESDQGALVERSVAMQVQDIFYADKKERYDKSDIDSLAFYGRADETYYLDDYTRFPVMEEVMREYVPGVMVRKRKDGFHFINLGREMKRMLSEDPLILLDGVRITNADEIMTLDPRKVKKLEVMTQNYYLGPVVVPGIVSYTTYKGDLAGFPLNPKNLVIDYEGLQLQREFYSPVYPTQKERDTRMPDQRSLLYWNPDITTDENGKVTIEFYTSDLTGNFSIHAEGLSKNGYSGSSRNSFSVRSFDN